jgi:hypothetical protein
VEDEGERTWCFVSRQAAVGDTLFLYVARAHHSAAPESSLGIVALYKITGPSPAMTGGCADFAQSSMGGGIVVRVAVALIERFPVSLLFKDMRADGILRKSTYIRQKLPGNSGYFYRHTWTPPPCQALL